MTKKTKELTNLDPNILQFQEEIRARFAEENKIAKKGQTVFVGSSAMEIFPIEKWQKERDLGLSSIVYNRGIRATTTADLLAHIGLQILDLEPSKVFINIGSNDIGFNLPEAEFISNYDEILTKIKTTLAKTAVYVMAYYPLNTTDNFGEEQDEHDQLYAHRSNSKYAAASKKVEQLAISHGYKFINVNEGLADESGSLRKELTFDGAHMLSAGYEIVLENLRPYINE